MGTNSPLQHHADFTSGRINHFGNLPGSSLALAIATAALESKKTCVVIAKDTNHALSLEKELKFFLEEAPEIEILSLPDWETLPYDLFSPHQDIISERIYTLSRLKKINRGVLVVPVTTLLHRLPPASHLQAFSVVLKTGQCLDISEYRSELEAAGYQHVETVYEHGEFAVRGSIFDIFPMGSQMPYRIDLLDDTIDTLRTFDPESQRSVAKTDSVNLLPASEYPFDQDSRKYFIQNWHIRFPDSPRESPVYQDIRSGLKPPGIEYYLPLFFESLSTIRDYLSEETIIIQQEGTVEATEHFWQEVEQRYEDRRYDIQRPILKPSEIFVPVNRFFSDLKPFNIIKPHQETLANRQGTTNFGIEVLPDISVNARLANPLAGFLEFCDLHQVPVLVCAESTGRREAITDIFKTHRVNYKEIQGWHAFRQEVIPNFKAGGTAPAERSIYVTVWPLDSGFLCPAENFAIISEAQLLGQKIAQTRKRRKSTDSEDAVVKNLTELVIGAPVVHIDHGVGRYLGLQSIEVDGQVTEFLTLSYADEARLYVPVTSLHLISRYSGTNNDLAPLHRLGTDKWSTAKKKALEKIRDTAAELLEVYARRDAKKGFRFQKPDEGYQAFCDSFPFEETPDQLDAIEAIEQDMMKPQPMDRLVCGDVGFGKTEVAMRAAYLATNSGKQVAILAPTTLLAQQHFESFNDRFSETPVKIDVLSRFKSTKDTTSAVNALKLGQTDIVIGTHKLLQGDIKFKNLGLLIIDEEHRFGVQQKEKIKALRAEVDILTLTATPIPRTLNMAMGGIRDLSIIATPPARRLSVKTFVRQKDKPLIKEAIMREILRGGQVFYLHNEVKSIDKVAEELQELVPESRISVAHGQMRERQLEHIMSDFYHKKHNVLVCTTIIETGIDIPSANTIIIDRADKFGLAQLHQLRGRVGRSHHQAYAYLLTPHPKSLTRDAEKRLDAISASQDLGAGFTLATHDMEIRGAGELLGEEQSGQIQSIGFSLYMELLEQAVKSIQQGKNISLDQPLEHGAEINLRIPALIPDDYLPDVHSRLILYKRIANAKSEEALLDLRTEIIDRYGLLPEPLKNLMKQASLKLKCDKMGITKIDAGATSGKIEFAEVTSVDPVKIVQLIQKQFEKYTLKGGNQLRFKLDSHDPDGKLSEIDTLLEALKSDDA
ncbi:MAG: transcription-repair coupling factor [Proteobacteria bacterium]|nr:MAG: transcription-repair coupling factor [Pseudomonadota bacterium]